MKKRVRATLTAIRQLEEKVALVETERDVALRNCKDAERDNIELKKAVSKQKVEIAGLKDQYRLQMEADKCLSERIQTLKDKVGTLEQSNNLVEEELKRVKHAAESLSEFNDQYKKRITELENRGFWARVFNK